MTIYEPEKSIRNVCDLKYLNDTMGGKKHLIKEIIDVFLKQVPEELISINNAIAKADYSVIKNFAHMMKSSVSIMGISELAPILQEMENLGAKMEGLEKINLLNHKLNSICNQAIYELEKEKNNYI